MKQHLHRIVPVLFLTLLAFGCSKQEQEQKQVGTARLTAQPSPEEPTGEALFTQRCRDCHLVQEKGGVVGPDLSQVGSIRNRSYLQQVIREPSKAFPGSVMPPHGNLSRQQINSLVDYLGSLK